jgi:hypothetical protein
MRAKDFVRPPVQIEQRVPAERICSTIREKGELRMREENPFVHQYKSQCSLRQKVARLSEQFALSARARKMTATRNENDVLAVF